MSKSRQAPGIQNRHGVGPVWGPGIASSYIGAVVGAGFASGQELWQFFVRYGAVGWWGVVAAGAFFALFGRMVTDLAAAAGAGNYRDLLNHLLSPGWSRCLDGVVALALYGGLSVMLAGLGVLFEVGEWGRAASTLVAAALVITALLAGLRTMLAVHAACSLFFILAICTMLFFEPTGQGVAPEPIPAVNEHMFAIGSGLVYASYNALLAGVVLASLAAQGAARGPGRRQVVAWATWGGGLVGLLAVGAAGLLFRHPGPAAAAALPLAAVAALHPLGAHTYPVVLSAAMLTTALANAHALTARLVVLSPAEERGPSVRHPRVQQLVAAAVVMAAVPASLIGFAPLIATIYPVLGWLGLPFVAAVIYRGLWKGSRAHGMNE